MPFYLYLSLSATWVESIFRLLAHGLFPFILSIIFLTLESLNFLSFYWEAHFSKTQKNAYPKKQKQLKTPKTQKQLFFTHSFYGLMTAIELLPSTGTTTKPFRRDHLLLFLMDCLKQGRGILFLFDVIAFFFLRIDHTTTLLWWETYISCRRGQL